METLPAGPTFSGSIFRANLVADHTGLDDIGDMLGVSGTFGHVCGPINYLFNQTCGTDS
jgi:hypothetical protein